MIEVILTLDYEIYGNGEGSLKELVYDPARKLLALFENYNTQFVTFVEAAEIEVIESAGTDPAIDLVKRQLHDLDTRGFEIGLHLHPQWYNARYEDGQWALDYAEYNLCNLPENRINQVIARSIEYLRMLLGRPDFSPVSFRAGNWLLQPTRVVAQALTVNGIKIDSSVYKGGVQHQHNLNYRQALKNGYFWRFSYNVNVPDPRGALIEIPIHTRMRPIWFLLSSKRIGLQQKGTLKKRVGEKRFARVRDYMRFRYPIKFDFCRMSIRELTQIIEEEMRKDKRNPGVLRPLIAIGHTKDLVDIKTVDALLSLLHKKRIKVTSFRELYNRVQMLGYVENERRMF